MTWEKETGKNKKQKTKKIDLTDKKNGTTTKQWNRLGWQWSNQLKQLDDEYIYIHGVLAKINIFQRQTSKQTYTHNRLAHGQLSQLIQLKILQKKTMHYK